MAEEKNYNYNDTSTKVSLGKFMKKHFNKKCLQSWFPILIWFPKYNFIALLSDITAGLAVGCTVVPQGLAYAEIANLPLEYGLYSAFMSCFIYFLMGGAKDITIGPTTILSFMTLEYGYRGSVLSAIWLTFMTGVVMLLLGLFRMGFLVSFISTPVISGITTAVAITIGFTQIKNLLGLKSSSDDFINQFSDIIKKIQDTKIPDALTGLTCIVALLLLKYIENKKWGDEDEPIALSQKISRTFLSCVATGRNAIIILASAVVVFANPSINFSRTNVVRQGLPTFKFPDFSENYKNTTITAKDIFEKIGIGFAITPLLGLLELIACVKVFSVRNKYSVDHSQEIITLGICNIISSFVSSYPVTASMTRTAINSQSSVKTPASGITTGIIVLLALGILSQWFTYIPKASLAAVIVVSVTTMIDLKIIIKIFKVKKSNLIPYFLTLIVGVFLGIEYGILVGIGVSIFILIYPMAKPEFKFTDGPGSILIMQPDNSILFPAVEYFKDTLQKKALSDYEYKSVILDCLHISRLDYTFIQGLSEILDDFAAKRQRLIFANLKEDLVEQLENAKIKGFLSCKKLEGALQFLEDDNSDGVLDPLLTDH